MARRTENRHLITYSPSPSFRLPADCPPPPLSPPLPRPAGVLQARGHSAVRRELLVGFDPLPPYTAQLQRRLGDLAVACADFVGGSVVALKWRAAALAPAPLRPEAAHLACPAGSAQAAPAEELLAAWRQGSAAANGVRSQGKELSAAAVVPDIVGALADALALGEGLVEAVQLQ